MSSTIVPWTHVGGTRCCCTTCGSFLIDELWNTFNVQKSQRILLTEQQYEDIRTKGLRWSTTSVVAGDHYFGGAIVSQFPSPVTYVNDMTFPTITFMPSGLRSDKCYGNLTMFNQATAVFTYNALNMLATVGIFGPFVKAFLQEAGQGRTGVDAPLPQPALYITGVVSRSAYPPISAFGSWTIDDTAGSMGTVLGEPLKGFYDTNYATTRIESTTTITIAP